MSKTKDTDNARAAGTLSSAERVRRAAEPTASFGLLLICAGLVAPFAGAGNPALLTLFKWIYAAGALIFTGARIAGGWDRSEPFRVRRLRRMEMWAGFAFCIAAFFWFWNVAHIGGLTFRTLSETILFTLVGALIQIVASWMLTRQLKKSKE